MMHPSDYNDFEELDFDDRGPDYWEDLSSWPERDLEDLLENGGSEEAGEDDPDLEEGEAWAYPEDEEQLPEQQEDAGEQSAGTKRLPPGCLTVCLTEAMLAEAIRLTPGMHRHYVLKNNFGDDDPSTKQLRGLLGEMAYAQSAFGNWRRQGEVQKNQADFGLVDVKTSRHHPHRELVTLNLIESESSPGTEPPCYALYVQVFVDLDTRVAYLAGWCTGRELWSGGKSPIPKGNGALGYMRPVSKLHPMSTLLARYDQLDDGRQTRFRPSNLRP